MEVRAGKEKAGGVVPSTEDLLMPCVTLCEDRQFYPETCRGEQSKSSGDDVEVTIVDPPLTTSNKRVEEGVVREDDTESMSSFGDSGLENYDGLGGDAEVESQLRPGLESESALNGCGTPFGMRKKRLTEDWKSFIHPVMWRCKWIELQLKEFQTQALKYERELAEHEQHKQFEFGTFLADDFHAKSLPLSFCTQRQQVMKRKKRKRIEETTALSSYISQHTVFSYYEHKRIASGGVLLNRTNRGRGEEKTEIILKQTKATKKIFAVVGLSDNPHIVSILEFLEPDGKTNGNLDDVRFQDGWDPIESKGCDNGEQNFRKLEAMQLLVRSWKASVDKIVSEIPEKFFSVNILSPSAQSDPSSCSNPVASSPLQNGASSPGVVAPSTDIFNSIDLHGAGENSCENGEEQILMHNQGGNDEMQDLRYFGSRLKEEHPSPLDNQHRLDSDADLLMPEVSGTRVSYGGKSLPKSRVKGPITNRSRGRKRTVIGNRGKKS